MNEFCTRYGAELHILPPFRPDRKGIVEKTFDLLQGRYKPMLRGKGVIEPDAQDDGRQTTAVRRYWIWMNSQLLSCIALSISIADAACKTERRLRRNGCNRKRSCFRPTRQRSTAWAYRGRQRQ